MVEPGRMVRSCAQMGLVFSPFFSLFPSSLEARGSLKILVLPHVPAMMCCLATGPKAPTEQTEIANL